MNALCGLNWQQELASTAGAQPLATLEHRGLRSPYARQLSRYTSHTPRPSTLHSLPVCASNFPGFWFEGVCVPAERVGGDHFNCLPLANNRLGILIFDVSGKGPEAALVAARLRLYFQLQAWGKRHVKDVLMGANDFLSQSRALGHFATALYGVLDPKRHRFTFARAGHEPLMLVRDGKTHALAPSGLPLGIGTRPEFDDSLEVADVELRSDDRLFLFTDGLTEAFNAHHEEFGHDRILNELCASAGNDVSTMTQAVKNFAHDELPHDDLTMLSIRVQG